MTTLDPTDAAAQAHVEGRPAPEPDLWLADRRADRNALIRAFNEWKPDATPAGAVVAARSGVTAGRDRHLITVSRDPQDVPATADIVGDDGDCGPDLPECLRRT